MDIRVETTRNIEPGAWAALLDNSSDATPFHMLSWISACSLTFGYKSLFLLARLQNGDILAGLPFLEETGLLSRVFRKYHSLPWGCYGSVIARDGLEPSISSSLLTHLLSVLAQQHAYRATVVDFSGNGRYLAKYASRRIDTFTHVLMLDRPPEEIYDRFDYSIKKNIRKAQRSNVVVRDANTLDEVDIYYNMTQAIARKYARPSYSRELFRRIFQLMVPRGEARITLAFHNDKPLAGALHIISKRQIFNWLTASYPDDLGYRPNDALDSFMIEWASRNGLEAYNFGGSPLNAAGLIRFKEKWGACKKTYTVYEIENMPKSLMLIQRSKALLMPQRTSNA
jgi:CelD/BcsL family acetyltransferase involved in cellulose biosynthesis